MVTKHWVGKASYRQQVQYALIFYETRNMYVWEKARRIVPNTENFQRDYFLKFPQ